MNKPHLKKPCVLAVALGCVLLASTGRLTAQTYTILHSFYDPQSGAWSASPSLSFLSGNVLYGTGGGVFQLNTDGTGYTNIYPSGGSFLLLSSNTLYGISPYGGASFASGFVF